MDSQETLCDDHSAIYSSKSSESMSLHENTSIEFSNYKCLEFMDHSFHKLERNCFSSFDASDQCEMFANTMNSIDLVIETGKDQVPSVPSVLIKTHFVTESCNLERIISEVGLCLEKIIDKTNSDPKLKLYYEYNEKLFCWQCTYCSPYSYCKFNIQLYSCAPDEVESTKASYIVELNRLYGRCDIICSLFQLLQDSLSTNKLTTTGSIHSNTTNINVDCGIVIDQHVESLTLYHYVLLIQRMLTISSPSVEIVPSWDAQLQGCYWLYNLLLHVQSTELFELLISSSCIRSLCNLLCQVYKEYSYETKSKLKLPGRQVQDDSYQKKLDYLNYYINRAQNMSNAFKISSVLDKSHRKYINMFKIHGDYKNASVLLIDDNVDGGGTFEQLFDLLIKSEPSHIDIFAPLNMSGSHAHH